MKKLLIVDDNDKYSGILQEYFKNLGYEIDIARTAQEGLDTFRNRSQDHYSVIVTDITMESQTAGLGMLSRIRKLGFGGTIVVASTGFDFPSVITLSRIFLKRLGVHYLVRKTTVLQKEPKFWPIGFFEKPRSSFEEIHGKSA